MFKGYTTNCMDKKTIVSQLKEATNGSPFISINELARILRISKHDTPDGLPSLLRDLEYIPQGRAKRYLVTDVATRLMERRRV